MPAKVGVRMKKESIKNIVARELESFLTENGYELHRVEFVKEGRDWFLRVYVDKPMGAAEAYISTDDCEKVSRFLSERLDELDPIEQNYYLEVSSPGMDRELLKDSDYERFKGQAVEVKLYSAIEGKKKIEGILAGLEDGKIVVVDEKNQRWELPREQVSKAKLAVVF